MGGAGGLNRGGRRGHSAGWGGGREEGGEGEEGTLSPPNI